MIVFIWEKIGKIFEVDAKNRSPWMYSHSSNPTPYYLENDIFRVFFSTRDAENKSNVGFFDLDLKLLKVENVSLEPSLEHGVYGEVDESGIGVGCFLKNQKNVMMYYMAWQTPNNEHWRGDIATAILGHDEKKMHKPSNNVMLGINSEDKISLSYPFILQHEDVHHLWYGSTESWDCGNGEMLHVIKHAYSKDLKNWIFRGCCIKPELGKSQAFSRPVVVNLHNKWHMWYSYRGNQDKYKIGYAFSDNMLDWITCNNNKNVIYAGDSDAWDSEMVCYPYVFHHADKLYMLYNGNSYGKTGIGLAVAETEYH